MSRTAIGILVAAGLIATFVAVPLACTRGTPAPVTPTSPAPPPMAAVPGVAPGTATARSASTAAESNPTPRERVCGGGKLKVHFYDVGQALAALVTLPDGRHILVDAGESAKRAGCGAACSSAHEHLVAKLGSDLGGKPIDLMWITHQHSDHIGGAIDIINQLSVKQYVDNGRDLAVAEIEHTHQAATATGVHVSVVEPGHDQLPLASEGDVKITAIAPSSWLPSCKNDRNECSILLRIDYCASSILFTGDAEVQEEALLDTRGRATLLQVGHHGSDTSSGPVFIAKLAPKYAVISAGKQGEGMNKTYCHPRASTVQSITQALGGAGSKPIHAFDAKVSCKKGTDANWVDVPASDHLWATERDGDVVLTTTGDGVFARE